MSHSESYQLITQNLQEIIGEDQLKEIVADARPLRIYWGTAPTGQPHVGYLAPLLKIAQFLQAGCEVTILFADLHAFLDAMKSTWEQLEWRVKYYQHVLTTTLTHICVYMGVDDKVVETHLRFVRGTEFQLSQEYSIDVYQFMSKCSLRDANKAGAEVVKQCRNPKMSGLLYPGLQSLDEEYLKVDAQFGGIDQRKIFMLAEKMLPLMGYSKRIHLMNPMIRSFQSDPDEDEKKMSSSGGDETKIRLTDTPAQIRKKIGKAFCREGEPVGGLMQFIQYVIFPSLVGKEWVIERDEKYGGSLTISHYTHLEELFIHHKIHPTDVKMAVSDWIIHLLAPVREISIQEDFKRITSLAYT